MSQHDYDIANATAPNARADINNALKALASTSSGGSAPSTTYANMIYYNTTNNVFYKRNEADSGWVNLGTVDETANTFTPSSLTFTPVQQGGGTGQNTNKIYLGWSGTNLKVQIDSSDQGDILTDTNFQAKLTDKLADGTLNAVGTYAFLSVGLNNINQTSGNNVSGSALKYASLRSEYYAGGTSAAQFEISATSPSGTWKLMGDSFTGARNNFTSLFLKVAG
jgi:hypothetical protein